LDDLRIPSAMILADFGFEVACCHTEYDAMAVATLRPNQKV
jgi:hypothetical protein